MCGNFGLLLLGYKSEAEHSNHSVNTNVEIVNRANNPHSDRHSIEYNIGSSCHSNNTSSHGVEPINESFMEEGESKPQVQGVSTDKLNEFELISPLEILRLQTARTEFRGGQAGGISSFEYDNKELNGLGKLASDPSCVRVRCVSRKRYPLADDLNKLYKNSTTKLPSIKSTISGSKYLYSL